MFHRDTKHETRVFFYFEALYLTHWESVKHFTQALKGKGKILNDKYAEMGNETYHCNDAGNEAQHCNDVENEHKKQRGRMNAKANKEPDLQRARNKSVQFSNHWHVELRNKHNLNTKKWPYMVFV